MSDELNKKTKYFGFLLACFSILIWGITFVSTKSLLTDFSAMELLFVRFIIAYIVLWIIHPKSEKVPLKFNIFFVLAGLTGVTIYQFAENIAINYTSASNVSIIVSICPIFTAIISQIFLKEKHLSINFIVGFIIALTGVAFVSFNGSINLELNPRGDLLALLAAVCWGFYSLFVSIINKKRYHPIFCTRRCFFFAIIFMLPLVFYGSFFTDSSSSLFINLNTSVNAMRFSKISNWINLIFLSIFASALCFAAWNKTCEILGTVKVTTAIYLIPVVTIIFAFFILHEKITFVGAIGTLLTITGLFISTWRKRF